jgi:hypothetical protein
MPFSGRSIMQCYKILGLLAFSAAFLVSQSVLAEDDPKQNNDNSEASDTKTVTRTAVAGKVTRLDFTGSLNPDCSVRSVPAIRILAQPSHGSLNAHEDEGYPRFPPNTPYAPCDKQKTRELAIEYSPNKGYVGKDFLSYRTIFDEGRSIVFNIVIDVIE